MSLSFGRLLPALSLTFLLLFCRFPLAEHLETPAFPTPDTVQWRYVNRETGDTLTLLWIRLENGARLFQGGGMQDTWPEPASGLYRPVRLDLYLEGEVFPWKSPTVPFLFRLPLEGSHTRWNHTEQVTVRGVAHDLQHHGRLQFSPAPEGALMHHWGDTVEVDGQRVYREVWQGIYRYGEGWDTLRWVREGLLDTLILRLKRVP